MTQTVRIFVGTQYDSMMQPLSTFYTHFALHNFGVKLAALAGGYTRLDGYGASRECPSGETTTVYETVLFDWDDLPYLMNLVYDLRNELRQGSIMLTVQPTEALFL